MVSMKRSIKNGARTLYGLLDRLGIISGNPWYYVTANESIPIRDLVSPLRLDILVRVEFLEFCADHLDLYFSDFARFYRLACQQPYFTWYRDVNCVRFSPRLLANEEKLRQGFEERVSKTVDLYRETSQYGLDSKHPIILHSGRQINPTSTGKEIGKELFAGDGCHRIALLISMGKEYLQPDYYKIRYYKEYSPLDNTSMLIKSMSISREDYYVFLSLGYSNKLFANEQDLLAYTQRVNPSSIPEIENITAVDNAFSMERYHGQDGDQRRSTEFSVIKHLHRLSGGPTALRTPG